MLLFVKSVAFSIKLTVPESVDLFNFLVNLCGSNSSPKTGWLWSKLDNPDCWLWKFSFWLKEQFCVVVKRLIDVSHIGCVGKKQRRLAAFLLLHQKESQLLPLVLDFWTSHGGNSSAIRTSHTFFPLAFVFSTVGSPFGDWLLFFVGQCYTDGTVLTMGAVKRCDDDRMSVNRQLEVHLVNLLKNHPRVALNKCRALWTFFPKAFFRANRVVKEQCLVANCRLWRLRLQVTDRKLMFSWSFK